MVTLEDLTGDVSTGGDADVVATDLSGERVTLVGSGAIDLGLTGTSTWVELFGPGGIDVTLPAGDYDLEIEFDKAPTLTSITHDPDATTYIKASSPSVTLTGI